MVMTKCKECKKEVSAKAKACPHCGVKNPGFNAKDALKGLIVLAILVGVGYWYFSDGDDTVKEPPKVTVCADDDGECIFKAHLVSALNVCEDPIQNSSKYEYEWTNGLSVNIFSRYVNEPEKHQMTYVGDKLKFTNGFNAKVNMAYWCTIDTKTNQLIDYYVSEGRLPQ